MNSEWLHPGGVYWGFLPAENQSSLGVAER